MRISTMRVPCGFLILMLTASAQQPPAPQATGDATFSSNTQLVIETVTVRDKSGKGVEGLTLKDFTVTEDNVPQTIKFFEYQKLPDIVEPLPPRTGDISVLNKFPKSHITAETPGNTRYRDHRLMALYFDMTALPPADQLRSIDAARKFITTQMTSSDLVAIMMFNGGAVNVLQDFTDDRNRLATIIETIAVGESQGFDQTVNDDSAAHYYEYWLEALEKIAVEKALLSKEAIDERHRHLIDNPVPHDHVARRTPIKIA